MSSAAALLFCSLLARTLGVIAPQLPDFKTGDKKIITGPFWHEVFTETYEEHDDDVTSTTSEPLPFFEDDPSTNNVTAQLGSRVHLHCRVHDLGEKTISWVRRRGEDLHLLSFGRHTYSADSRYSLAFEQPNDWRLLIQYAGERDEGYYECQVSTHPPLVRRIHLSVVVPRVEIVDERGRPLQDKLYKEGSIIELRCVVSEVPQPARQVNWRHGARLLNYDTKRGGVSVKTEATANGALSRLYIANANRKDSGNYTCALADVAAAAVSVHVLRETVSSVSSVRRFYRVPTEYQRWSFKLPAHAESEPICIYHTHVSHWPYLFGENPLAMQRGGASLLSTSALLICAAIIS